MRKRKRALRLWAMLLAVLTASISAGLIFSERGSAEHTEAAGNDWDSLCEAEYETTAGDAVPLDGAPEIRAERLPTRWYAGDYGKKPTVRRQGSVGTCWAFAAVSALEATLLPEQHLVFSADHMSRKNAFTVDLDEGGDSLMAMAYLSGWQGPVTEAEDPYGDGVSPDDLAPAVHVQEMQLFENAKTGTIKTAVRKYGAVQTSLYMKRSETPFYYNEKTRAYYCPDEQTPNHDVVILGWDDDYSRFLFSETPERDGAFICQNTWEDGFGEDGIFYVSYADPNIAKSCVCYTRIESADNYARIYQYDDCGWQGRQGYADESCWCANVYTAVGAERTDMPDERRSAVSGTGSADGTDDSPSGADSGEQLAAVGFYAVGPDTSYELYLVHDFQDAADFSEREYLQSGKLKNAGYYTVDLDAPQPLSAGERFAVAVKLTTSGTDDPVAVEYRADEYTQKVTTEGKESYLSQYGERWENTQKRFGTNVCLKAYTR